MNSYNTIIIGSGISGIFTLKHLIEEGNKDVLVLDKNPEPFGVWNINNKHSVFENTHAVSSKLYMTISDFPLAEEIPEFPHHSIILNYYKEYANHFNLYEYIRQNVTVYSVKKNNNTWIIKTSDKTYYASYVVIASGTINDCPNIPDDDFYNNFTGEIYHSDVYEKIKNIENKKILIIGGSDTMSDCAMELKNKNKVTVSIKNGVWFQNKNFGAYEPADMFYSRTTDFFIKKILSKKGFDNNVIDTNTRSSLKFWWGESGSGVDIWVSKCDYLNSYYVKSREIIDQIAKGVIIPENGIKNINKKTVTFETNNSDNFDIILFCTGYKPLQCMKFLDNNIVDSPKYKHIFYTKDTSIMFVGFIRPYLTSIPMLSELQSRWVAKFICRNVKLPNNEVMEYETKNDIVKQQKEFPCAVERLKTIVDPYDYCNLIADKIGANINIFTLLFTDPSLCYMILVDSWNHHIYRLNDKNIEKQKIAIENIKNTHNEKTSIKIRNGFYEVITYYLKIFLIIFIIITYIFYYHYSKMIKFIYNLFQSINKYLRRWSRRNK
jgi:hypothetical protein